MNFLAVAGLLQVTGIAPGGSHSSFSVAYGKPFPIVYRRWSCDWNKGFGLVKMEDVDYRVDFEGAAALLLNVAVIGAIVVAGRFLWQRAAPRRRAWSRTACVTYVLTTLVLLTINVSFIVAHRTETKTLQTGLHSVGWPVPQWSDWLAQPQEFSSGMIAYADVYNGLIVFTVPLLLSLVCEMIVRRCGKRHNQRMHQIPMDIGTGDP